VLCLWGLPFILIGANFVGSNLGTILDEVTEPFKKDRYLVHDPGLLDDFSRAVRDSLAVIGHGIDVDSIAVRRINGSGAYDPEENEIVVGAHVDRDQEYLLVIAAHETVHALFSQSSLERDKREYPEYWLQVEETTAYILGAHIAGRALSRRGGNGEALTRDLLAEYRDLCDPDNPDSHRHRIEAHRRAPEDSGDSHLWIFQLDVHFGPLEMVDGISEICRSVDDPWIAAHRVGQRYLLWEDR
jgi:hypothetical protein